jgi:hypothetical protein
MLNVSSNHIFVSQFLLLIASYITVFMYMTIKFNYDYYHVTSLPKDD